jgi:predicted nucleotidyltransferase
MGNLSENELAALGKLREVLTGSFKLVELRLFGSKARGDSHCESDIDVLIVLEALDWETRKAICDLCTDISIDYSVVLAPTLYSVAEFKSGLTKATPFYQAVSRESVAL